MRRVLILEDEPDLADLYRMTLEGEGYEVLGIFCDPREPIGIAASSAPPPPPDLIILDERLSGLSGTEFLPDLRDAFPDAKILVATADPVAGRRAVSGGADLARQKPFTLQDLMRDIALLLEEGPVE
jgi:DNA-binding response OmpR family regulator